MRALAALPVLALLAAGCVAPPEPATPAPVASSGTEGAFGTLRCPFLPVPDPTRPLERCNVRATPNVGPANEIDLALDPWDPDHYVVVGKGYAYTRIVGQAFLGEVITPYATTFDGGLTWTEGFLQPVDDVIAELPIVGPVGSTSVSDSDPVVEFAPDGHVIAETLRVSGAGRGLPIFRSLDGGVAFEEVGSAYSGGTDKNWIVSDHVHGIMYTATLHNGGIGVARSLDSGLTWGPAQRICSCSFAGLDVGPDGEVYVIGVSFSQQQVVFTRSLDHGLTWSTPVPIGLHTGVDWNVGNTRLFRTPNIQQLAASKVDGGVYATWASEAAGAPELPQCVGIPAPVNPGGNCFQVPRHDIWLARSSDFGGTWEAPVRINDDLDLPVSFQFMPQVAVSPNGQDVHVAWLDQRHDPSGLTALVYYAHSPDGGATWGPNLLVSDQPFLTTLSHHQSATNLAFVGDYIGLQATDDKAVIAWPDTRYGRADIFIATVA